MHVREMCKVRHVTREEEKAENKFCILQEARVLLVDDADERKHKHNRHVQLYMSDMMHDFSLTL